MAQYNANIIFIFFSNLFKLMGT